MGYEQLEKQLTPDQDPVYQTGQSRVVQGFPDAGREPGHRDSSTWGQSPSVVTTNIVTTFTSTKNTKEQKDCTMIPPPGDRAGQWSQLGTMF